MRHLGSPGQPSEARVDEPSDIDRVLQEAQHRSSSVRTRAFPGGGGGIAADDLRTSYPSESEKTRNLSPMWSEGMAGLMGHGGRLYTTRWSSAGLRGSSPWTASTPARPSPRTCRGTSTPTNQPHHQADRIVVEAVSIAPAGRRTRTRCASRPRSGQMRKSAGLRNRRRGRRLKRPT